MIMCAEVELLSIMQVGTELGVSASSVSKIVKQYPEWVQPIKRGRSILYSFDALRRLKVIRRLQEQKKTSEQIEKALYKKFEPLDLVVNLKAPSKSSNQTSTIASKPANGLIKQVKRLEARINKLEEKISVLSKQLATHKKLNSEQLKLAKIEQELNRLAKILEG